MNDWTSMAKTWISRWEGDALLGKQFHSFSQERPDLSIGWRLQHYSHGDLNLVAIGKRVINDEYQSIMLSGGRLWGSISCGMAMHGP